MNRLSNNPILHIEACNFVDTPMGGQLNFSRQLIMAFGHDLALAGLTSDSCDPIGVWFYKTIEKNRVRFFAIGRTREGDSRPLIPARITTWLRMTWYQKKIQEPAFSHILVCEHSILMALKKKRNANLCYRFPGVDSPLSISRYTWAKYFSIWFDRVFYRSLATKVDCILAAADETAISELKKKAGTLLEGKSVLSFPTRTDTRVFFPGDKPAFRRKLNLPLNTTIVTVSGRLHWAKGWSFILKAFCVFAHEKSDSLLLFAGEGTDRVKIEQSVRELGLEEKVLLTGRLASSDLADHLRASDLFVSGSLKEGWSTVLVEAMACHLPIVTTRFSSADTLVENGINGFVVPRDPELFANKMVQALNLKSVSDYSSQMIERYALKNLKTDLLRQWGSECP